MIDQRVEGRDIRGKLVTLKRSSPEQLSLFQTFLPDEDKYSNTIELYDAIPKYYPIKHMRNKRVNDTFLPHLEREFEHKGNAYRLLISPGRVIYNNGTAREFYPSFREELVEEALRKIACDRLNGVFLDGQAGVQFTLYELKKELKTRGHDIDIPDLIESLKICNLASLTVMDSSGKALIQSPLFPVLLIASKADWMEKPKQTRCYVQFHPLVTASINHISYRQYDYLTYMTYKHRLSRWLHKRLAHNYVQASMMNLYSISLSTILRDSGAYQAARGNDRLREVETALDELKAKHVVMDWKKSEKRGARNKIIDITYTLYPDFSFVEEVKKANARSKRAAAASELLSPPRAVAVQVVQTYRLRSRLCMAYPVVMETPPSFPHEVWERTPPEAQAYIRALEARVETLASMVHAFQEQVRTLQEQLHQTSQNSSRPPSSDPPQHGRPRRPRSKRRRGGQPGHPGHTRTLIPVEDVDEVVVIKPEQCAHCQGPLSGDDPKPWRHQVIELPPMQPVVTEYQWHQLWCSACGEVTRAPWPAGVPSGTYGPRVQATVALYTGAYRLSKRTTQQAMDEVFGVPVSVGTISQLEQATTEVIAAPVEEARTYVHEQAVAHLDETSWRQGDKRAWLWVAVTSFVTVFLVRMSRGGQVARELVGERFSGILVTDRYSAYNWYPVRWRQLCWSHLLRDFEAMRGRGGASEELGEALLAQAHQMFTWWHRVREGTLQRSTFRSYMTPLRREVEQLLEAGRRSGIPKTAGTCRDILKRREALWTFVQVEGVEPTNNTAERSIRPAVLWRKGSFGTQSAAGSRFVESMLTVVATLKQQRRNVLEYLTAACEAALRGEAAPSLLPASDQQAQAAA